MATFTAYPVEKIRNAAVAYGLDPDFVEAVYAAESSRGLDPNAMRARTVKRKRDSTVVRGPFQLEDGTAADLIRKHKLGNVDVNDPEVHLDLALKLMQDLQKRYDGDANKMAQAYLGGPGSVGTNNRDELGTSVGDYSNKIIAEMTKLRGGAPDNMYAGGIDFTRPMLDNSDGTFSTERTITVEVDGKHYLIPTIVGGKQRSEDEAIALWRSGQNNDVGAFDSAVEAQLAAEGRSNKIGELRSPFMHGADAGSFGDAAMSDPFGIGNIADWLPPDQGRGSDVMGVPVAMGGSTEPLEQTPDYERRAWIERLVDDELSGRDFSIA